MINTIEIPQGAEKMEALDINNHTHEMIVRKIEKNYVGVGFGKIMINARSANIDDLVKTNRQGLYEIPEEQVVKINADKVIQNPENIQEHAIVNGAAGSYYIILNIGNIKKGKASLMKTLIEKPKIISEKLNKTNTNTKEQIKDAIEEKVDIVELLKNYGITDGVSFLEYWIYGPKEGDEEKIITQEDWQKIALTIGNKYKNELGYIKIVLNNLNWNFYLSFYNFMKKNAEDKENKINMYDFFLSNRFDSYMTIGLNIGELPIFNKKKPSAIDGEEITMMLMKDFCKSKNIDENETLPVFRDLIIREPRKSNVILKTIFSTNREEKIEYIWKKLQEKNK